MKYKFIKVSFLGLILQSFIALTVFALFRFFTPLLWSFFAALIISFVINLFLVNYVNATVLYYHDYLLFEKQFSHKVVKIFYQDIAKVAYSSKKFIIYFNQHEISVPPPNKKEAENLLSWLSSMGIKLEELTR